MPRMAPDVFEEFLEEPHVGVIATLRKDGMPYTVPVWWLWKKTAEAPASDPKAYPAGEIWITGTYSRVWCKQLLGDGRSSLCIEAMAPVSGHIEFDGVCQAFERPNFDIWPISRELAEKYVGRRDPGNESAVEAFFANMQTEPRLLFRLTPQVVRAIDMRVYRGKRADREFKAAKPGGDGD